MEETLQKLATLFVLIFVGLFMLGGIGYGLGLTDKPNSLAKSFGKGNVKVALWLFCLPFRAVWWLFKKATGTGKKKKKRKR